MLEALGVDNFGINNLVGSIIAMSSLVSGAISASILRFITYAIGEGDKEKLKTIFSTSINVMIVISIIAVILLEGIGGWFLNFEADIPEGRLGAANWILQFYIITLILNLLSTPYNATILGYERMSVFAYISIVEALLKLGACFAILIFKSDRLILFAIFNSVVALIIRIFYSWYCQKHFEEARYSRKLSDRSFFKEIMKFTGWFMLGNVVWVLNTQGVNMLINVFFGVVLNAARGIALSVTSAITTFVNNFTVAFTPQITKSYASADHPRLLFLIFEGTKITWFLVLLFIIPVFWESQTILRMWLETPPEYSDIFLRFALFESWSMIISFALHNTILATGKLKRVQLQIAVYTAFIFPITWLCFKLGVSAWYSCIIFIIINTTAKGFTIYELKRQINFPVKEFMIKCVLRCTLITVIAFAIPGVLTYILPSNDFRFLMVVVISLLWTSFCGYYIGLNKEEKAKVKNIMAKLYTKIFSKKAVSL